MDLIDRLWSERNGCVSLQVLQEFYDAVTRKLKMNPSTAAAHVERFGKWTVHRPAFEDVLTAIDFHRQHHVSFWDALILRSARRLGCSVVWSEDLADGQSYDGVVVRNPFER